MEAVSFGCSPAVPSGSQSATLTAAQQIIQSHIERSGGGEGEGGAASLPDANVLEAAASGSPPAHGSMPAKADLAASSAHESVASVPPPPPAEAPDLLRAVLSALLQIACNGLPLHDPTLGTPIGEHLAAEAIAVLQVGRHIFFPTPAHRRDLLLQLLPRAPGLGGFEGSSRPSPSKAARQRALPTLLPTALGAFHVRRRLMTWI